MGGSWRRYLSVIFDRSKAKSGSSNKYRLGCAHRMRDDAFWGQHGRIHGAQPTEKTAPNLCCVIGGQVLLQGAAHTVRIGISMVSYEISKTDVGRQARERMNKTGLVVQGNLVRSPNTLLGKESVSLAATNATRSTFLGTLCSLFGRRPHH